MKKAIFRKKKSPPELYTKNSISLSLITIDIMWLLQLVGNVVTIYCFMDLYCRKKLQHRQYMPQVIFTLQTKKATP